MYIFDGDKQFLFIQLIFVSNRKFNTEHVKNFSFFFQNFSNSKFFSLNCQIPGFSRIPGFLAALDIRAATNLVEKFTELGKFLKLNQIQPCDIEDPF